MDIAESEAGSIIETEDDNSEFELDQTVLDDDQITKLLNEHDDTVDKDYEQSEFIINNFESQSFSDNSIFSGIRCVAHTLQLAVIDCLKDDDITKLLNKVRFLVKRLRNQTYTYLIKKEKLKLPILDCLTRWHSTLDMLERILYLKEFIKNMSANDHKLKKVNLNHSDWEKVETLSKTLLPSKICTKKLQYEQLTLTDFYGAWITCKLQTDALNTSISKKLLQHIVDREKHIMDNKVLLGAIFLDPRYKITLNEDKCNTAIEHLIKVWVHLKGVELKNNIQETTPNIEDGQESSNSSTDSTDELEKFLQNKDNKNDSVSFDFNIPNSQTSTIATRIETLLKSYHIDQNRLNYKVNILQFWKTMEASNPELSQLAKVVFSVPATQVSVERLFSGLKFLLSPYRSNISSKNLENQLLIRTNRLFNNKN
ncbi:zinc finger BED domain-containing protein 4-like [Aphis gossypii]|uniref:zinc finger BED domain-containing protein 4-like n=1 Tax=Aphis gossypii TaxID=80765 RepID=UPI0021593D78|nr:zinc finger BED domain-containing protein 4-like [Aphis gossypii]